MQFGSERIGLRGRRLSGTLGRDRQEILAGRIDLESRCGHGSHDSDSFSGSKHVDNILGSSIP
jgi:hypothetical protein